MIKLIINGTVYDPNYVGKKDILIANNKIACIQDSIKIPNNWPIDIIDAEGKIVVPGFIDGHVHICGGGYGGYRNRVPEINLSKLTKSGITTVISFLGADASTKTLSNLIGKANGLIEEGLSVWLLLGSYELPSKSISGNIIDDIILHDRFIGVKSAIACSIRTNGSKEELAKTISSSALAGTISGKAGITVLHVGASESLLRELNDAINDFELPREKILATHINRNDDLINEGIKHMLNGGYIDFTTIIHDLYKVPGTKCSEILRKLVDNNIDTNRLTFSTDGNVPISKKQFEADKIELSDPSTLHREFRDSVLVEKIDISTVLKIITKNPATFFNLNNKGELKEGKDADINILDKDSLEIVDTIANGKIMVRNKKTIIMGEFEK